MTMAKLLVAGGAFDQESCGETLSPTQFGLLASLPAYLRAIMALSFQEDEVTVKGLGFMSAAWPAAANNAAPRSAAVKMRIFMERSSSGCCRSQPYRLGPEMLGDCNRRFKSRGGERRNPRAGAGAAQLSVAKSKSQWLSFGQTGGQSRDHRGG